MARKGHTHSFSTRLGLALVGIAAAASLALCTLLIVIHYRGARGLALQNLKTQVRVIAIHSEAALAFGDAEAARETLEALRADPGVEWAALYDATQSVVATYSRAHTAIPAGELRDSISGYSRGDLLVLSEPVAHANQQLGRVVAAYDLRMVYQRLWQDIALSILATAGVVAGAALIALRLRRLMVRSLSELAATARRVSETGDYNARAHKRAQDEFGDLTDLFNTMMDRIQSQDAELHSNNRELQQFLYSISHDLKSPLVTISGFLGVLKEGIADSRLEQVSDSLDHMARATKRMSQLIDDLLKISRVGRVCNEPELIDVNDLVRDTVQGLATQLASTGAAIDIQPGMPSVTADKLRLSQVFENLLTNALKYGMTPERRVIEVGGGKSGEMVRYFVRDHGPGIPVEHRQRVFVLFQRLCTDKGGTGVGLSLVARVIDIHGGRVWIDDTPGGGATFWFELPQRPAPAKKAPRNQTIRRAGLTQSAASR